MQYLLDTHVWLWMPLSPDRLPPKVRKLQLLPEKERPVFFLSAISFVEAAMLVENQRVKLDSPFEEWVQDAQQQVRADVIPVTRKIALKTASLENFNHYDPCDRTIVATALVEKLPLITADRVIRAYKSVSTFW